ncbi:hypothetical protein BaRGS_00024352, partial [Batillaria attramentaria]
VHMDKSKQDAPDDGASKTGGKRRKRKTKESSGETQKLTGEEEKKILTEDMRQFIQHLLPGLSTSPYFVPPQLFQRTIYKCDEERSSPGHDVIIQRETPLSDHATDKAQSDVMRSLRYVTSIKPEPMVVLSNYPFENYLLNSIGSRKQQLESIASSRSSDDTHKKGIPPSRKSVKAKTVFPNQDELSKDQKRGDFDAIIISRQRGFIVIEVKAVGYDLKAHGDAASGEPGEAVPEDIVNRLEDKIKQAMKQLSKAGEVLNHMCSDLPERIPVTKAVAFPNVTRRNLRSILERNQDLAEVAVLPDETAAPESGKEETTDGSNPLLTWWSRLTRGKSPARNSGTEAAGGRAETQEAPSGQLSEEIYEQIIARFCGPYSKVTVESLKGAPEARTVSDCIHLTGLGWGGLISWTLFNEVVSAVQSKPHTKAVSKSGDTPGNKSEAKPADSCVASSDVCGRSDTSTTGSIGDGKENASRCADYGLEILKTTTTRGQDGTCTQASPSKDGTCTQASPSKDGTCTQASPSQDGTCTHASPSQDGTCTQASPSQAGTCTHASPSQDGTCTQASPSQDGTCTHASPSQDGTCTQASPSQDGTCTQASPSQDGTCTQASPSQDGTCTQASPSQDGTCTQASPSQDGTCTHASPSQDGTCTQASPSQDGTCGQTLPSNVHSATVSKGSDVEKLVRDLLEKYPGSPLRFIVDECPLQVSEEHLHSRLSGSHGRLEQARETLQAVTESVHKRRTAASSECSDVRDETETSRKHVAAVKNLLAKIDHHLSEIGNRLQIFQPANLKPTVTQSRVWKDLVSNIAKSCRDIGEQAQQLHAVYNDAAAVGTVTRESNYDDDKVIKGLEKTEATLLGSSGIIFNVETNLDFFAFNDLLMTVSTLHPNRDMSLWGSGVYPSFHPVNYVQKHLKLCVRCPPRIQQVLKHVEEDFSERPNYTYQCTSLPDDRFSLPTDGPDEELLDHSGHVNEAKDIKDCRSCGQLLADYIDRLRSQNSSLRFEDIVISGTFDICGISCELLQALVERDIPLQFADDSLESPPPYPGKVFVT